MRTLRVLLLTDESLVPPDEFEGDDYTNEPWKTEYDVLLTLRGLGHQVRTLGVVRNLDAVEQVHQKWKPDIAFNMLEDVYGVIPYDYNMVAFLELLGLAYTGCNPAGLLLSRDKALTKKLLTYHHVHVPNFIVCRRGRKVRRPKRLGFPLIVKSLTDDASVGISQRSVVRDDAGLVERVTFVHERVNSDAIVEQFIPGREFYVGLLGNHRLEVFPPWELVIEGRPEGAPLLATHKIKWQLAYQKKLKVKTQAAEDLPERLRARIAQISRRAYRVLNLSGYARLDYRLAEDGRVYLLEANANPQLAFGEDFAESAAHTGLPYERLIQRILSLGLRWKQDHDLL